MSFLNGIMGKAMEAEGLVLVTQFIEHQGGVQAIVSQFEQKGLGNVAQSWVQNGASQPINPEHIMQVFGPQLVNTLAQKVGVPPEMVAQQMAKLLPQAVDQMTPNGQVPPATAPAAVPEAPAA